MGQLLGAAGKELGDVPKRLGELSKRMVVPVTSLLSSERADGPSERS